MVLVPAHEPTLCRLPNRPRPGATLTFVANPAVVAMKRIPKAVYETPDQIEARIRQLELECLELRPDTDAHRRIMRNIAQLRIYVDAKRWLARPVKQEV